MLSASDLSALDRRFSENPTIFLIFRPVSCADRVFEGEGDGFRDLTLKRVGLVGSIVQAVRSPTPSVIAPLFLFLAVAKRRFLAQDGLLLNHP